MSASGLPAAPLEAQGQASTSYEWKLTRHPT